MTNIPLNPDATWQGIVASKEVTTKFGRPLTVLIQAGDRGQFPAPVRLRGKYYWVESELNAWLNAQRQKPASEQTVETSPEPEAVASGDVVVVASTTNGVGGGAQ
jgi:predicted DNA-binding transcriptional regulator AlpA